MDKNNLFEEGQASTTPIADMANDTQVTETAIDLTSAEEARKAFVYSIIMEKKY